MERKEINIGDTVIYGDRLLRAKVLDIKMSPYFYGMVASVEFEDPNLFPRIMDVSLDSITLLGEYNKIKMSACTCGLKFTREGGRHSSWCDIKNDE